MKVITRELVLLFLLSLPEQPKDQFNQAFEMYRNSKGKSLPQERFLNRAGFTPTTLNTVLYELKKLYKISDSDLKAAKIKEIPVEVKEAEKLSTAFRRALLAMPEEIIKNILISFKLQSEISLPREVSDELSGFLKSLVPSFQEFDLANPEFGASLNDNELAELIGSLKDLYDAIDYPEEFKMEIEVIKMSQVESGTPVIQFVPDAENVKRSEELRKVIAEAPAEVKTEIRFRDEFPFISDPNIPDELKILVTEKFNHYHDFCDAHKELVDSVVKPYLEGKKESESEQQITNDVIFGLAKSAVENFEMDQLIYDEFVHYRDNNKVLGVHPIFKRRKLAESVEKMTMAEAAKRKANLENYIRRDTNKAENAKTPEEKTKFEEKVLDFKEELILVNLKLGESVTK